MKTSDFEYPLPPALIAQTPIEPRDASRMLVIHRSTGQLEHRTFADLPSYLRAGDLLVGNESRVIPARVHAMKPTGGSAELFLLRPAAHDSTFSAEAEARWECLVGGKGLRPGLRLQVLREGEPTEITATVLAETETGGRLIAFSPPIDSWIRQLGEVPLPPYIHQPLSDPERYQTVYSRVEGSVASSTAGLHFTPDMLLSLREAGIRMAFVTLHIGLDTFRPVKTDDIEAHQIHREWAELGTETARMVNETRLAGGRVIAVGTTVVRVLETGANIASAGQGCGEKDARSCGWRTVAAFGGETDLFIRPGYRFRAVDAMITNFHLPRSTLLMLVSAFAGKSLIDKAYAEAIARRYRFYSFGDATLIL